jgi:hypothetical protein
VIIPQTQSVYFHELATVTTFLEKKGVRIQYVYLGKSSNKSIDFERNYFHSDKKFEQALTLVKQRNSHAISSKDALIDAYSGIIVPGVKKIDKEFCSNLALQAFISKAVQKKMMIGLMGLNLCHILNRSMALQLKEFKVTTYSKKEIKDLEVKLWKSPLRYPLHELIEKHNYYYLRGKSWYSYSVRDQFLVTSQNMDSEMAFIKKFYKGL